MLKQRLGNFSIIGLLILGGCAHTQSDHHFASNALRDGELAEASGDLASAIRNYRTEIKENPSSREAYLKLGYALLDGNYTNEAYKTFEDAQERFGKCMDTHRGMGAVLLAMSRPEEALNQYNHVLDRDPRDAKAINGQGIAYELMGYTMQAQTAYRAAMELDPANPRYENNLGLSLTLNGEPQEGVYIFERLAKSPNATPRIRQNLALAYGLNGEMNKARHVGRMDLSDNMVRNNLNYIRAMQGMPVHTSRFVNALPTNREQVPLMAARSWRSE